MRSDPADTFATGGRSFYFQYHRHPRDPNRTAAFDNMITKTLAFHA